MQQVADHHHVVGRRRRRGPLGQCEDRQEDELEASAEAGEELLNAAEVDAAGRQHVLGGGDGEGAEDVQRLRPGEVRADQILSQL